MLVSRITTIFLNFWPLKIAMNLSTNGQLDIKISSSNMKLTLSNGKLFSFSFIIEFLFTSFIELVSEITIIFSHLANIFYFKKKLCKSIFHSYGSFESWLWRCGKLDQLKSKTTFEKCSTWNFYAFPNEHAIFHVWHHKSKPLVGPNIWINKQSIDKHERWSYKIIKKWWKNSSTFCKCFYINKPQTIKKCKESVNMMYHVYTITCKENERIYVGQSANP